MTWWIKNFKWKRWGFDKNPQNINRKWRPKKWISALNAKLIKSWHQPVTKADVEATVLHLVNLPEAELRRISTDEEQPMMARVLAQSLLWFWAFEAIFQLLDRGIWKPKQVTEEVGKKEIEVDILEKNKKLLKSLIEEK